MTVSPGDMDGTVLDLSRGGARCRLPRPVDVGVELEVAFCHRCGTGAEGVVRWAAPGDSGGTAGVEFFRTLPMIAVTGLFGSGAAA